MKSEPGPPMTLGNAAAVRVRLIVWCKECQHQVEPDAAEMSCSVRRRNSPARLARASGLLPLRQPAGRYGGGQGQVARVKCAHCCRAAPSTPVAREWGDGLSR